MNKNLEKELIEDYLNKIPLKELKKKYKTSSDTIYKVIDSNNVKRTNKKDISKFKDLTNEETQYWIGYLCADGNIEYNESSRIYKVSLFSKDECVINDYINYFGKDICKKYIRKQNGIFEASIHSKELCKYFINELNIIPNKGLILDPNIDYTVSFIRGYFDGDGCIRNGRAEAKFTSGSKKFIDNLCIVFDVLGIFYIIREKGNAYDICFERKEEVKKLYIYLYSEGKTKLLRKYNNFVALFGNIEDIITVNCGKEMDNPQPSNSEMN